MTNLNTDLANIKLLAFETARSNAKAHLLATLIGDRIATAQAAKDSARVAILTEIEDGIYAALRNSTPENAFSNATAVVLRRHAVAKDCEATLSALSAVKLLTD